MIKEAVFGSPLSRTDAQIRTLALFLKSPHHPPKAHIASENAGNARGEARNGSKVRNFPFIHNAAANPVLENIDNPALVP